MSWSGPPTQVLKEWKNTERAPNLWRWKSAVPFRSGGLKSVRRRHRSLGTCFTGKNSWKLLVLYLLLKYWDMAKFFHEFIWKKFQIYITFTTKNGNFLKKNFLFFVNEIGNVSRFYLSFPTLAGVGSKNMLSSELCHAAAKRFFFPCSIFVTWTKKYPPFPICFIEEARSRRRRVNVLLIVVKVIRKRGWKKKRKEWKILFDRGGSRLEEERRVFRLGYS